MMQRLPDDIVWRIGMDYAPDDRQHVIEKVRSVDRQWLNVGSAQFIRSVLILADGDIDTVDRYVDTHDDDPRDVIMEAMARTANQTFYGQRPFEGYVGELEKEQRRWMDQIELVNRFTDVNTVAGVDVAYWNDEEGQEWGACCIVIVDCHGQTVAGTAHKVGTVGVPYIPGYLAFRELPLILETAADLAQQPDVFMFDGNGYLHPRHMGIATYASFSLGRPTVGVAKTFSRLKGLTYQMPEDRVGAYTLISGDDAVYGAAVRTRAGVKPVFVSCGNWIDLETAIKLTMGLVTMKSRIPLPLREADLATRRLRRAEQ